MKLTLEAVAALTGGKILSGDPELTVFGVASLLDASREEASFLGNEKYFQDFLHTSAGIVLVPPGLPAYPEHAAFVEVDNPSMAFNALVKYFMASAYRFTPGIHPTAIIDPTASFNPDKIHVGAYTCIGAHCIIGDGTDIGNGCDIGDGVTMGGKLPPACPCYHQGTLQTRQQGDHPARSRHRFRRIRLPDGRQWTLRGH